MFQKLQCSDIDAMICFASSTDVSLFIVSIILASLKCLFRTLAKMILNTQSVKITFARVGSLLGASFADVGLKPYSVAEDSHQLFICASSLEFLRVLFLSVSTVDGMFSKITSMVASTDRISTDTVSEISPVSK